VFPFSSANTFLHRSGRTLNFLPIVIFKYFNYNLKGDLRRRHSQVAPLLTRSAASALRGDSASPGGAGANGSTQEGGGAAPMIKGFAIFIGLLLAFHIWDWQANRSRYSNAFVQMATDMKRSLLHR
jgi:hypothetical protein